MQDLLAKQHRAAIAKADILSRLLSSLRWHTGRYVRTGKVRQHVTTIGTLMAQATVCMTPFHDKIMDTLRTLQQKCDKQHDRTRKIDFEMHRGPIKHPRRAIEKLVRSYQRDCGCLTDLVRCSVVFERLEDIYHYIEHLTELSYVGAEDDAEDDSRGDDDSKHLEAAKASPSLRRTSLRRTRTLSEDLVTQYVARMESKIEEERRHVLAQHQRGTFRLSQTRERDAADGSVDMDNSEMEDASKRVFRLVGIKNRFRWRLSPRRLSCDGSRRVPARRGLIVFHFLRGHAWRLSCCRVCLESVL